MPAVVRAGDGELDEQRLGAGQGLRQGQLRDAGGPDVARSGERQIEQAGAGHQNLLEDLMSRQPREDGQGEAAGKQLAPARQRGARAEPGMLRRREARRVDVGPLLGAIRPEALALEGIGRQLGRGRSVAIHDRIPARGGAVREEGTKTLEEQRQVALAAAQAAENQGVRTRSGEGKGQNRVGAGLDEDTVPFRKEAREGAIKANRLPEVAAPVAAIELVPLDRAA